MPKLAKLLPQYPDIKVEINTDNRLIDIVEQRYDAGVRLGEQIAKDMIAVRLGCMPEDSVKDDISAGRLVQVLENWTPLFSGYHLYYPNRRQPTPAFALLVDALRYRA